MFQELYMKRIVALIGVMAIVALGAYTYGTLKSAKYMYMGPVTISVVGKGEVFATPDVAEFSFTIEAKGADAVAAQNKAGETMDAVLAYLKETGVEEKDIKTSYYNMYPTYEQTAPCWNTGWEMPCPATEPKINGYEVSQSVTVKVRDTAKAGELVSGVGSKGARNVSGLSFTVDDTDALAAEAREKAIEDAREQAKELAKNLGKRLGKMTGYWEDQGGYPYDSYYGMGGDTMMKAEGDMGMSRPATLPVGESTVTAQVNISYEIR